MNSDGLYVAFRQAVDSNGVQIGFHRSRDQLGVLTNLSSLGFKKPWFGDARAFLRRVLHEHPSAFDACRNEMVIQMNHRGEVWFWDGFGQRQTVESFWKAEIILDFSSSMAPHLKGLLQGL